MIVPRRRSGPDFGIAFIVVTMTALSLALFLVGCQLLSPTATTTEASTTSSTVQGMPLEEYFRLLDESEQVLQDLATKVEDLDREWWSKWAHEMELVPSRRFSEFVIAYFYDPDWEDYYNSSISGYIETASMDSSIVQADYFSLSSYEYEYLPERYYASREDMMRDYFMVLNRYLEDIQNNLATIPYQEEYIGTPDDKELMRSLGGLLYKIENATASCEYKVMRSMRAVAETDKRLEETREYY